MAAAVAILLPAAFCLCLYVYTLAPTVVNGDSSEFVAAAHVLGIPHPTGYPLYMLMAKLFELIVPLGTVAFRINLFSALCGAASVALLALLALRVTRNPAAAALAGIVAGLNQSTWSQAVIAEVYALHGLLVMLVLLALLRWEERRTWRAAAWLALASGVGLAHHRSIVFVAGPALLAALLLQKPFSMKGLAKTLAAGLAPLVFYLYLPLRAAAGPLLNWGNPVTWGNFWDHVLARPYVHLALAETTGGTMRRAWGQLADTAGPLSWPLALVALAGAVALTRRRPALGIVTALSFVTHLVWFSAYKVPSTTEFHLPTFLIMALWVGTAAGAAQVWISGRVPSPWARRLTGAAVWCLAPALAALLLVSNYGRASQRGNWELENWPRRTLAQMKPNALLVGIGDTEMFSTWYMQAVHGLRRDITVVQPSRAFDRWYLPTVRDPEVRATLASAARGLTAVPEGGGFDKHCASLLAVRLAGRRPLYIYHPSTVLPEGIQALEYSWGLTELAYGEPGLLVRSKSAAGPQLLRGLVLTAATIDRRRVRQLEPFTIAFRWRALRPIPPGAQIGVGFRRVAADMPLAPDPLAAPDYLQLLPLNCGLALQPTPAGCAYRQAGVFLPEYPFPPGRYSPTAGVGMKCRGIYLKMQSPPRIIGEIRVLPAGKGAL